MGISALLLVLMTVSLHRLVEVIEPTDDQIAFLDEILVEEPQLLVSSQPASLLEMVSGGSTGVDPAPPPEPQRAPMLLAVAYEDPSPPTYAPSSTEPASDTDSSSAAAPQPTTHTTKPPSTTNPPPTSQPTSPPPPGTASGPVSISGESNVVIENLSISNPGGPCIRVVGSSNVTIRNSTIGPCGDWAVFVDTSSGVTVQNNTIRTGSSKGGVYGHSSGGLAVLGNKISNSGRNPIQFDKVTGSGNRIEGNSISSSPAEDMISIYKSGGTSGSWLKVTGNTLKDNTGHSQSGSGIMLGDSGGQYILVQGNKLTNPGQAGIGVAGGSNIRVLNNTVSSAQFSWSNVGIYVWNQSGGCGNIEVRGNQVNWLNKNGQSNPAWDGGGCGSVAGWGENSW